MPILLLKRMYRRHTMDDKLKEFKNWLDREDTGFPKEKWIYDWVKHGQITLEEFQELLQYTGLTKA
jgi:hypothetical protein